MDVGTNRVLRVVATLEFIQHQLSEMGHSDLLVTQTLHGQQCWRRPRGSVRRASGLVQTRLSLSTPELSASVKCESRDRYSGFWARRRIFGQDAVIRQARLRTSKQTDRKRV